MIINVLCVGAGAFIGAILRFLTAVGFSFSLYATFTVNLIGCFLIGLAIGLFAKYDAVAYHWQYFVIAGFLGGFTTFSAYGLDSLNLMKSHNVVHGFIYIILQVVLGIALVYLGEICARLS